MTDSKKPGVAFWTTVVLILVLVAYPLSFGPACWLNARTNRGTNAVSIVYRPIIWLASNGRHAQRLILWYASAGVPSNQAAMLVDGRIRFRSRIFADFTTLIQLIQTTVQPSSGEFLETDEGNAHQH